MHDTHKITIFTTEIIILLIFVQRTDVKWWLDDWCPKEMSRS